MHSFKANAQTEAIGCSITQGPQALLPIYLNTAQEAAKSNDVLQCKQAVAQLIVASKYASITQSKEEPESLSALQDACKELAGGMNAKKINDVEEALTQFAIENLNAPTPAGN